MNSKTNTANLKSTPATIVTALYDIGREQVDGRSFGDYLKWFSQTLTINNPMTVFVPAGLVDFVKSCRKDKPTAIIQQDLRNIPCFNLREKILSVIDNVDYRNKIKDPGRIECTLPEYTIVQYSKFGWLKTAAEHNFFKSTYFIWVDAGISRFSKSLLNGAAFPGRLFLGDKRFMEGSLMVQISPMVYPELLGGMAASQAYLFDNRSFVWGGLIGMPKSFVDYFCPEVLKTWIRMVENGIVNNEQILLGHLYCTNASFFTPYVRHKNTNEWDIIEFISH